MLDGQDKTNVNIGIYLAVSTKQLSNSEGIKKRKVTFSHQALKIKCRYNEHYKEKNHL
jgi:hypothetical protein